MQELDVDGLTIHPVKIESYDELIKLTLPSDQVNTVFPQKASTIRYALTEKGVPLGYFKILSARPLADGLNTKLSLHRQA